METNPNGSVRPGSGQKRVQPHALLHTRSIECVVVTRAPLATTARRRAFSATPSHGRRILSLQLPTSTGRSTIRTRSQRESAPTLQSVFFRGGRYARSMRNYAISCFAICASRQLTNLLKTAGLSGRTRSSARARLEVSKVGEDVAMWVALFLKTTARFAPGEYDCPFLSKRNLAF